MSAYKALQEAVDQKADELGLDIRLGYIGNIYHGPYRDDRYHYIWVEGIVVGSYGNTLSISLGETSDENFARGLEGVAAGSIERAIIRAEGKAQYRDVLNWKLEVVMDAAEVADAVLAVR